MFVLITYILDTVVLMALVLLFARDRRPKLARLFLTSLGVAAAYCICDWIGQLGRMIVVPLVLFTGIALMWYCQLKLKQAVIVAGLFFALHVLLSMTFRLFF
jgi:hypothetical protein